VRLSRYIFLLTIFLILSVTPLASLTVKLGSLAPVGSPWEKALRRMASEWRTITEGEVDLKIFMGGIAGGEEDMLRKVKIGQLHAAAITALGVAELSPDIAVLSVPFLIQTEEELDRILEKASPLFEEAIEREGFKVLTWSKSGWLHFFAKKSIVYPEDLKAQRLTIPNADPDILQTWRVLGFKALPLSLPDILSGLQSGMVDAFYAPPLVAAVYQWFSVANNMSPIRLAPVMGAIVIGKSTWNRIPERWRAQLLESVRRVEADLYGEIQDLERESLVLMQRNGLDVNDLPEDAEERWQKAIEEGFDIVVGKSFSREIYDLIAFHLGELRDRQP
jgi:TRAP-type C4-dicarboxylate transport system substrate-binding protein